MSPRPVSLSDEQLTLVREAAHSLPVDWRDYLSEKRTDHTPSYEGGPSEAEERGASDGANDLPGLHGDEALPPLAVRTYAGSGDHD